MNQGILEYIKKNQETGVTYEDIAFNAFFNSPAPESFKLTVEDLKRCGKIKEENGLFFPRTFSAQKALELFMEYGDQDVIDEMEITDILYQFRYLREFDGYVPLSMELQLTVTDFDNTFEVMKSRIVLFENGQPIFCTDFSNITDKNQNSHRGVNKETLLSIFEVIEARVNNQPDVLIEVSGGVAEITKAPSHVFVDIKDWDNESA